MITHIPVIHQDEFLGVVSYHDCLKIGDPELPISSAQLNLEQVSIAENEHIFAAIREFASTNIDILPVVDSDKHLLGSIVAKNLMPHFARMIAADSPGGVIVLEINANDYNLAEIAQIVQSNDAKILSVTLGSALDMQKMDVTIKVNRIEIGPILQTLFRFNYLIKFSWSTEDAYHEGLHERFDALMNYLNI